MSNYLPNIYEAAPAPLEMFTTHKIAPENQALLDLRHLEEFKPLTGWQRRRMATRANALRRQLVRKRYNEISVKYHERLAAYQTIARSYVNLKTALDGCAEQLAAEEAEGHLIALVFLLMPLLYRSYRHAREEVGALRAEGIVLKRQLDPLMPIYQEYRQLIDRIDKHDRDVSLKREQLEDEKKFIQEVKHFAQLLRNGFSTTPGCHHIYHDRRGKRHIEIPRLGRPIVMSDAIWFRLESSRKGIIGWHRLLPYGVLISDLVSEKTLDNLSVYCGRQVEVRRDKSGTAIYFVVNRLDSPDGLPRKFYYRQMFDYYPEANHKLLPWPVGVSENRKTVWKTFADLPHILIAGSSQSGKSNLVNCIISTIIQMNSPAEARVVLIDNKGGVEFTHFRDVPHLIGKIIKTVDDVLPALKHVMRIMHRRLTQLEATRAKDIGSYNEMFPAAPWARIVVFIDELATILDQGDLTKGIHASMRTITSIGRACGIHMVLCTQYSNVDVLPGSIKANLAVRISGAMPSGSASMTVLDSYDAKNLERIAGRMMIAIGSEIMKVQTPYISDGDIADAVAVSARYGTSPHDDIDDQDDGEDTQDMLALTARTFTQDDLLEVVMENLQGALKIRPIFDIVKTDRRASRTQVEKLVNEIIDAGEVEYGGEIYEPIKQKGNFYKLRVLEVESEIAVVS